MKGVSRRSLLLFAIDRSFTPKAIMTDSVVEIITKAVVGPELSMLINFRKRFRHVNKI